MKTNADDARVGYLEQLGQTLTGRGWTTAVTRPPGEPPVLRVTNPELAQMTDTVFCCLSADGAWQYMWRWGDLIARADDLPGTVEKVERVLGAGVRQ